MQPPTPSPAPVAEEEEYYSSLSLFLVCILLILSLWTSYYLQIKRIRAVHETLVSIFAGMAVGLIVRILPDPMIREMLTFKHTIFFNLLLPPIILNSGYELKQENFFRNFGSILTFAFLGTFISAVGVGIIIYVYSTLGLESLELTLVECLIFGSTLSATDPVTILAIFNQYKVDPKLYTIIFGESLLNDAVSIVMYETLNQIKEFHVFSVFNSIGIFLVSFSFSMILGVAFGLATSLILKHSSLYLYPSIESCLVALAAYTSYFFSNGITLSGLSLSGIVSLLFCGITLKHYAYHTMSRRTQRATKYIFQTLAQLSENFIFIYLGLSLFTSAPTSERVTSYVKPLFIVVATVAVIFTRYAAVFPLSEAINLFHKHARGQRNEEIPHSYQMMLFWAGLRGAVGVALAAGFKGDNATTLRTTVLVVVVISVLLFGGTTARMLEVLGIRTGVEDEAASSDDEYAPLPFSPREGRNVWLGRRDTPRRWINYNDDEPNHLTPPLAPRSAPAYARGAGLNYAPPPRHFYNHQYQFQPPSSPLHNNNTNGEIFSTASSDTDSDSGEVLPLVNTAIGASPGVGGGTQVAPPGASRPLSASASLEDGKWFQALDERYLLPLFTNATASRTFHARRARRNANASGNGGGAGGAGGGGGGGGTTGSRSGSVNGTPVDSEDELEAQEIELSTAPATARTSPVPGRTQESRIERGLPSPMLRSSGSGSLNGSSSS